MGIKSYIKAATIDKNVFWYDLICKKAEVKSEWVTRKTLKAVEGIDPILDYDSFKRAIIPWNNKKINMMHWGWGAESRHYGHLEMLFEYAGINEKPDARVFPAMEHAVSYQIRKERSREFISRCTNLIYQSKYKNSFIHEMNPIKPVFNIGPYIQYAKSVYTDEEERALKEKFGKTLVVFAAHHQETQTIEYSDEEFVSYVMEYAKKNGFDTVLASVYFCDVDKKIYEEFREQGAVLVSAGFREDILFIRRLRTLFNLADMVIANNVGTPVGFSKCLGVPYQMIVKQDIDFDERIYDAPIDFVHHDQCYARIEYLSSLENFDEKQKKIYDDIYEYYSGGEGLKKTPEEMRAIISICKEMYKRSKGNFAMYDRTVLELLDYYKDNKQELEYKLLSGAIKK